mmetsp:Transcript_51809/g.165866  ORF Transcript_51809/g.165866 Transcript_51809/m.165866 type:complete len:720 (-) Transcript_51809:136-2295(-)
MVRPRRADVLQAVLAHQLLPCLNTHPDMWHQDLVLRHLHLGLPHDEPFAGVPLIAPVPVGIVVAALHAHDRLLVLAHRELLEVHVGLEHHLAHGGARKPLGIEALLLHPSVGAAGRLRRQVQREGGLAALEEAHLQGQGEVLGVDGACRVQGGGQADGVRLLVVDEAAHAAWGEAAVELAGGVQAARDALDLPADVVLGAPFLLQLRRLLEPDLVLLLQIAQAQLGDALAVHVGHLLALGHVRVVADGQAALAAAGDLLALRVARGGRRAEAASLRRRRRALQVPLQLRARRLVGPGAGPPMLAVGAVCPPPGEGLALEDRAPLLFLLLLLHASEVHAVAAHRLLHAPGVLLLPGLLSGLERCLLLLGFGRDLAGRLRAWVERPRLRTGLLLQGHGPGKLGRLWQLHAELPLAQLEAGAGRVYARGKRHGELPAHLVPTVPGAWAVRVHGEVLARGLHPEVALLEDLAGALEELLQLKVDVHGLLLVADEVAGDGLRHGHPAVGTLCLAVRRVVLAGAQGGGAGGVVAVGGEVAAILQSGWPLLGRRSLHLLQRPLLALRGHVLHVQDHGLLLRLLRRLLRRRRRRHRRHPHWLRLLRLSGLRLGLRGPRAVGEQQAAGLLVPVAGGLEVRAFAHVVRGVRVCTAVEQRLCHLHAGLRAALAQHGLQGRLLQRAGLGVGVRAAPQQQLEDLADLCRATIFVGEEVHCRVQRWAAFRQSP